MIRYFNANIEDAVRIAVVEANTDDEIYEANEADRDLEIAEADLPPDFAKWKRYTAHAYRNSTVEVMSRNGD
jgi:hypothetical protein